MKKYVLVLFSFLILNIFAITGKEIIEKVDKNRSISNEYYEGTFTIIKNNRTLVKKFFGYAKDSEETFYMEFTNPEDNGVKYLKISDELWIYFPDADDYLKISGSMLKQGMMGSDMSYSDMVTIENLEEKYSVDLLGEEVLNKVPVYKIELIAKKGTKNITYYKEILYVDKDKFIILNAEYFAKSGRLLKTIDVQDIKKVKDHYFPTKMLIKDMRRKNSKTIIEFPIIKFDIKLPKNVFSLGYLKR
ncbi:outer membrane lipoprotein-sorting protein [bacterium]|nr:outer membrane lipoprotein-sorting protein [bacterium]